LNLNRHLATTLLIGLALAVLGIYLFVSAPPKLPDGAPVTAGERVPVDQLFRLLAAENASIRALYTSEIVGAGSKQGLKFQEDWKQREVQAGPLPALFLRETSTLLQRDVPGLNLFLGSDYPIVAANRFQGLQVAQFAQLKADRQPRFFQDPATRLHTAMFPDIASAAPCVQCHNDHAQTPKRDWVLNDVMGATTWMFPRQAVALPEALQILATYRRAVAATYALYLDKVRTFPEAQRPAIGTRWPREGRYLPDVASFMQAAEARVAPATLATLLALPGPTAPDHAAAN
jgi:adenylate cyclase